MNMKPIKQHLFRIIYRKPKWAFGSEFGVTYVHAIDLESARYQYYHDLRGKRILHDLELVSIEQVADNN